MRPRCHERERDQIDAIVLEHGLERIGIAAPDESEEARRDLEPGHVANAVISGEMTLEHRQPAAVVVECRTRHRGPLLPQPPRRMQQVEMRHINQRARQPMQQVPRLDERDIEAPAVERDERVVTRRPLGHHPQQRTFVLEARQQELAESQAAVFDDRAAHEKRLRAGAARPARSSRDRENTTGRRICCPISSVLPCFRGVLPCFSAVRRRQGHARANTSSSAWLPSRISTSSPIGVRPWRRSAA